MYNLHHSHNMTIEYMERFVTLETFLETDYSKSSIHLLWCKIISPDFNG